MLQFSPIRTAIMMLVAQWYNLREATVSAKFEEMPMGVSMLLAPYRQMNI